MAAYVLSVHWRLTLHIEENGIGSALLNTLERTLPGVAQFDLTTNTVMEGNVPYLRKTWVPNNRNDASF